MAWDVFMVSKNRVIARSEATWQSPGIISQTCNMPPAGIFLVPARKIGQNRLREALTMKPIGAFHNSFRVTPASSRPP